MYNSFIHRWIQKNKNIYIYTNTLCLHILWELFGLNVKTSKTANLRQHNKMIVVPTIHSQFSLKRKIVEYIVLFVCVSPHPSSYKTWSFSNNNNIKTYKREGFSSKNSYTNITENVKKRIYCLQGVTEIPRAPFLLSWHKLSLTCFQDYFA